MTSEIPAVAALSARVREDATAPIGARHSTRCCGVWGSEGRAANQATLLDLIHPSALVTSCPDTSISFLGTAHSTMSRRIFQGDCKMLKRWKFSLAWFLGVVLVSACGPVKPNVPPTPPATPSPVCVAGQTHSCYHNPGTGWLYACPVYDAAGGVVGVQNETDRAKCPAKPGTPPVPPVTPPAGTPALIPDEELTLADDGLIKTWVVTDLAIKAWREAHPEAWRGDGACLIDVKGIDAAFLGIATELAKKGVIAGQSIAKSGQRSDCLWVNRTGTNLYEEAHLFDYGRACVATGQNAVKHVYLRAKSGTPPPAQPPPVTPPVTPPPTSYTCANPIPPPLQGFNLQCQNSDGSWKKWCDGTPQVYGCGYKGSGTNFCDEIGLGEMPGQPGVVRCDCAPGNEDDPVARECREAYIVGGKPLWKTDGVIELHDTNPFLARCSNCTEISICKADGTKCTTARLVQ